MNDSETLSGMADDIPRSHWRSLLTLGALLARLPRQQLVALLTDSDTTLPSKESAPNTSTTTIEREK